MPGLYLGLCLKEIVNFHNALVSKLHNYTQNSLNNENSEELVDFDKLRSKNYFPNNLLDIKLLKRLSVNNCKAGKGSTIYYDFEYMQ